MTKPMSYIDVQSLIVDEGFGSAFFTQQEEFNIVDSWLYWQHPQPLAPLNAGREHQKLSEVSTSSWGGLIITSVAQAMAVEDYRSPGAADTATAWEWWKRNRMPAKQNGLHRAMLAYGHAYNVVVPGEDSTGEKAPCITPLSPKRLLTFSADVDCVDDFPDYALRYDPAVIDGNVGFVARLYDDSFVYRFHMTPGAFPASSANANAYEFIEVQEHGMGVVPVARYSNIYNLDGWNYGEVEPVIPILKRIDQTVFDRIVTQRFSSWRARYIAGMQEADLATDTENGETTDNPPNDARAEAIRLLQSDILIAEDADTKFGTFDASDITQFIDAKDADLRDLAAISQTPPHYLLGSLVNIGAEALAAAQTSLDQKIDERKTTAGVGHQDTLRLAALAMGDQEGFKDFDAEIRWTDMSTRSLSQATDALGKMAQMLGVPVEMLWERIPGWTPSDVTRAKNLAGSGSAVQALANAISQRAQTPPAGTPPSEQQPQPFRAGATG